MSKQNFKKILKSLKIQKMNLNKKIRFNKEYLIIKNNNKT